MGAECRKRDADASGFCGLDRAALFLLDAEVSEILLSPHQPLDSLG